MIDSPPPGIRVSLLLFARYAELFGADRVDLVLPAGATVGQVVSLARKRPGGEALPEILLLARNLKQADLDTPVRDGDEVALLPPLAGG